jgi:hypothetical protein
VGVTGRLFVFSPTYRPVGGVVKLFDYARHGLDLGIEPVFCIPERARSDVPLLQIERFRPLGPDAGVEHVEGYSVGIGPGDLVVFSWPPQYEVIAPRLDRRTPAERVIHLIQNVRHADPGFQAGHARRLLARPMARISTNEIVAAAIRPYVHPDSIHEVVPIGHDVGFFRAERSSGIPTGRPLRVAYTTWKSRLGDRLAAALAGSGTTVFRRIGHEAGWDELRDLYAWSDVFLGTPIAQEGSYLPALEAMAAGAIVVVPPAGGNLAYCRFGENCLEAAFEDDDSYLAAIDEIRSMSAERIDRIRAAAAATAAAHDLDAERSGFSAVVARIEAEARPRPRRPVVAAAAEQAFRLGWE